MNIGDLVKQKMEVKFASLTWHCIVTSDGQQILKCLDSLTQKCAVEGSSAYSYNQIQIKNDDNTWLKYGLINSTRDTNIIYKILGSKGQEEWELDYSITKNILGYLCYEAVNKISKNKWAWFTLDLPFTLSPTEQFTFPGVILEYFDGSSWYIAKNIDLDSEKEHMPTFDPADYTVDTSNSFTIMNNTEKIHSDMFTCREENE